MRVVGMSAAIYADLTTGQWVGEYVKTDAEGNVTRRTEWFADRADAVRFARTGVATWGGVTP